MLTGSVPPRPLHSLFLTQGFPVPTGSCPSPVSAARAFSAPHLPAGPLTSAPSAWHPPLCPSRPPCSYLSHSPLQPKAFRPLACNYAVPAQCPQGEPELPVEAPERLAQHLVWPSSGSSPHPRVLPNSPRQTALPVASVEVVPQPGHLPAPSDPPALTPDATSSRRLP